MKTLREIIEILANLDADRATEQNSVGFNKFHSYIGHKLAEKKVWTQRDLKIARELARFYSRQVAEILGVSRKELLQNWEKYVDESPDANGVVENRVKIPPNKKEETVKFSVFPDEIAPHIREFIEKHPDKKEEAKQLLRKTLTELAIKADTPEKFISLLEEKLEEKRPSNPIEELVYMHLLGMYLNLKLGRGITIQFEYYPLLIDAIKANFPYPLRRYNPQNRSWTLIPKTPAQLEKVLSWVKKGKEAKEKETVKFELELLDVWLDVMSEHGVKPRRGKGFICLLGGELDLIKSLTEGAAITAERVENFFGRENFHKVFKYLEELESEIKKSVEVNESVLSVEDEKLLKELKKEPFPFQKAGIAFGKERLEKQGVVWINDEMGLGKTIQSIGIVHLLKKRNKAEKVLVVAPKSVIGNWRKEIVETMNYPPEKVIVLSGSPERAKEFKKAQREGKSLKEFDWVIINYESFRKWVNLFIDAGFDVVIADEMHKLKNPKTKVSRAFTLIKDKIPYKIGLTGTPITRNVMDLLGLLKVFDALRVIGLNEKEFKRRYVEWEERQIGRKIIVQPAGGKNLEELNLRLRSSLMIRREKKDVLKELPPKMRIPLWIEFEEKERKEYLKVEREFNKLIKELIERNLLETKPEVFMLKANSLFHAVGKLKVPYVLDWIKTFFENNPEEKLVIFAYAKDIQNELFEQISKMVPTVRISADLNQDKRNEAVRKFQEDEEIKAIVIGTGVGAEGITLTRANTMIFADLHYSPAILRQAEDRIHRIGQSRQANIYYALAEDTIDEKVWNEIIARKEEEMDKLTSAEIAKRLFGNLKKLKNDDILLQER